MWSGRAKKREVRRCRKEEHQWGLDIVGLIADQGEIVTSGKNGLRILGNFNDIESVLHSQIVDEVIICVPYRSSARSEEVIECCEREGVQIRIFSDFFGKLVKRVGSIIRME